MQLKLQFITSENPLARQVIHTEWILLGSAISLETLARIFAPGEKWHIDACLATLTVLAMLSIYWPENKPYSHKLALVLLEIFLVTLASAVGLSRWTWPLYLAVVARAALLLEGRHLWPVVFTAFICQESWYLCKWMVGQPFPGWPSTLMTCMLAAFVLTGTYGVLMVVVGWLMLTLQNEQTLRAETQRLSAENATLATQLERTRIAREIHDTLGHSLTSLKIQLELSKRLMEVDGKRAIDALSQAEQMAARSLTDTRVALQSVRNADFDFGGALAQLISEVHAGGKVKVNTNLEKIDLPNAVSYQLYRVVQESITNTLKHAGATSLSIELSRVDAQVELQIADDGKGFDDRNVSDGFGLAGMKERIASLQGCLEVKSQPEQGTRVKVRVPLA